MTWWFRPVIACETEYDLWLNVWQWIGQAHAFGWYPEADRMRRFKERIR